LKAQGTKGEKGFQLEEEPLMSLKSPENPTGKKPQPENEPTPSSGGDRTTTA